MNKDDIEQEILMLKLRGEGNIIFFTDIREFTSVFYRKTEEPHDPGFFHFKVFYLKENADYNLDGDKIPIYVCKDAHIPTSWRTERVVEQCSKYKHIISAKNAESLSKMLIASSSFTEKIQSMMIVQQHIDIGTITK